MGFIFYIDIFDNISIWQLHSRYIISNTILYSLLSSSFYWFLHFIFPSHSTILYHSPLCIFFFCLFEYRGKALGWRPLHLLWSEGHVNRGASVGPVSPAGTPRPPNPAHLPINRPLYRSGALGGTRLLTLTHPPSPRGDAWFETVTWHRVDSLAWRPWKGVVGIFSFNLYSCREGWRGTRALLKHWQWSCKHISTSPTSQQHILMFFLLYSRWALSFLVPLDSIRLSPWQETCVFRFFTYKRNMFLVNK